MAKKKKQSPPDDANGTSSGSTEQLLSATQSQLTLNPAPATGAKKASKTSIPPSPPPLSPPLIICRNKHWRYISAFHGPWLQLPPEILETLANANCHMPRPRPIDPSVFFDLAKIRRLVDDATNLAVRAASGFAASSMSNTPSAPSHAAALGLGFGGGNQMKLSRERKYRMREQATQKLSTAYRLDEIASSVATMQSASALEEVASLVLQRSPQDTDAKYVHFFHEKIPSRQLAESTDLTPLDEVISSRPTEGEPLRTRATIRIFKGDLEGAAADLTTALQVHRFHRPPHTAPKQSSQRFSEIYQVLQHRNGQRQEDIVLREDDQPRSLEIQLLFQRANVYLAMASQSVAACFPEDLDVIPPEFREKVGSTKDGEDDANAAPRPEPSSGESETQARIREAQKAVKQNAKRALRDYMAYLSHFDYSPDLSLQTAEYFARKVSYAANGGRPPRGHPSAAKSDSLAAGEPDGGDRHHVYPVSELFNSTLLPGLPHFPFSDVPVQSIRQAQPPTSSQAPGTIETLTYHPLLADALHSVLLCHCLMQTSAKELLRHAYMVARLARLADGYPIFQVSRSPARSDWIDVLRCADNWIKLASSWDSLCAPPPSATSDPAYNTPSYRQQKAIAAAEAVNSLFGLSPPPMGPSGVGGIAGALGPGGSNSSNTELQRKGREKAILDSLGNEPLGMSKLELERYLHPVESFNPETAAAEWNGELMRYRHAAELNETSSRHRVPNAIENANANTNAIARGDSNASTNANSNDDATGSTSAACEDLAPAIKPTPRLVLNPTTNAAFRASMAAAAAAAESTNSVESVSSRRWPMDDGRGGVGDYSTSLTERAIAVARWVREAPANAGSPGPGESGVPRKKKKKQSVARKMPTTTTTTTTTTGGGPVVLAAFADE